MSAHTLSCIFTFYVDCIFICIQILRFTRNLDVPLPVGNTDYHIESVEVYTNNALTLHEEYTANFSSFFVRG